MFPFTTCNWVVVLLLLDLIVVESVPSSGRGVSDLSVNML